jgi:hypothetical protein
LAKKDPTKTGIFMQNLYAKFLMLNFILLPHKVSLHSFIWDIGSRKYPY